MLSLNRRDQAASVICYLDSRQSVPAALEGLTLAPLAADAVGCSWLGRRGAPDLRIASGYSRSSVHSCPFPVPELRNALRVGHQAAGAVVLVARAGTS